MWEGEHQDYISVREIDELVDYVDALQADLDDEDVPDEDKIAVREELADYDLNLIEQLRGIRDDLDRDAQLISDDEFDAYAATEADDLYLYGVSEVVRSYFDYEGWARDLRHDYTAYDYDGVTYWARY